MAAGNTYTPIATATVSGTSTFTVTFSSISSSYTDLVLISQPSVNSTSTDYFSVQLNGDTGSNYSMTHITGNGTTATSGKFNNLSQGLIGWATSNTEPSNSYSTIATNFNSYSNSTSYKTLLSRSSSAANQVTEQVVLWRNTNAITSIAIGSWGGGSFSSVYLKSGSTFTLYGIAAA